MLLLSIPKSYDIFGLYFAVTCVTDVTEKPYDYIEVTLNSK